MYSLVFPKYKNDLILILKNHGLAKFGTQKGKLNGPGGKIEQDETAKESAVREFLEETTVSIFEEQLKPKGKIIGNGFEIHVFTIDLMKSQYEELQLVSTRLTDITDLDESPDTEDVYIVDLSMISQIQEAGRFSDFVYDILNDKKVKDYYL